MARSPFRLPASALPFVTRSLRGGRGRRFVLLSLLFAFLSAFVGAWLALGSGSLEREFRTGVELERERWERERQEYVLISDSDSEYESLRDARELALHAGFHAMPPTVWSDDTDYRVRSTIDEARNYLVQAAHANAGSESHRELRERARELLGAAYVPTAAAESPENVWYFDFSDAYSVERLESILAADGIPEVELYSSPLGPREALVLIGVIAGGVFSLLLLVLAPILVGVQQAQEVHENTLMPLTGTSMSPRGLALGLAAGPWSIVALFAAPQMLLFLLMAIAVGHVGAAFAMVASTGAAALLFTVGAQLIGQLSGRQRTPGIVGVGLLFLTGAAWIVGTTIGLNLDESREMAAVLSMMPQASSLHFLREAFVPAALGSSAACDALLAASIGTLGALVLSFVSLQALSRKIGGGFGPLLGRWEALIAAFASAVMVMLALPFPEVAPAYAVEETSAMFYFGSLAILALPLALLMMARVPTGDVPAKLRRVPVLRLLGELWAFVGLHFLICLPITHELGIASHPIALLYLIWSVTLLGLLAIRVAAVPPPVLGVIWSLFCAVAMAIGYGHAVGWTVDANLDASDVFALTNLSPLLGVVQAALTVWVPWSLVRVLQKKLAGLDARAA